MTKYVTTAEIRDYTGVSTNDWGNDALTTMLNAATERIDKLTGRTWQGEQTITDMYYTGDNTDILILDNVDITSLDALSINVSPTGTTYTDITTTKVRYDDGIGIIELQPDAEVNYFPEYRNSVKISYKYGNSTIPDDIKLAALYLVAHMMKIHEKLHEDFTTIINQYKLQRYRIV